MATVTIDHYSDLLCVWAYIAHARTVELQAQYPDSIDWRWHYLSVFGDVQTKFKDQWQERGGSAGYAAHVLDVLQDFDHVVINPDCWTRVQPASSTPAHLWLTAVRLQEGRGELSPRSEETFAWHLRRAFFRDAADIGSQDELVAQASQCGFEPQPLLDRINDGSAFAVLCQDMLGARQSDISVSPTYVFNNGRQRLTGNVGYRIIEANVKELLEQPHKQQSWC